MRLSVCVPLTLFIISVCLGVGAAPASAQMLPTAVSTIDLPRTHTASPMSVAYHPTEDKYYASNGGSSSYPAWTYDAAGNLLHTTSPIGMSVRSFNYNPNTGNIECCAYSTNGLYTMGLDGNGYLSGSNTHLTNLTKPNSQSMPAYDPVADELYAYNSGSIYRIDPANGQPLGSFTLNVGAAGNPTFITYATGYDRNVEYIILYGRLTQRAFAFDLSGNYIGYSSMSGISSPNSSYGMGYCNGQIFVWDSASDTWEGYTVVQPGPQITSPAAGSLGELTEGQTGWSETFEAAQGTPPYDWSLSGAPGWLSFNPTAGASVELVAATVGAAGSFTFDVTVTDANGDTATESYDVDVNPPPVVTGPGSLDEITEGFAYLSPPTFAATGGTAPLTWSVTGGPPGLAVIGAGVLNGPVDAGTAVGSPYDVTVMVEDANGVQGMIGPLSLTVNPAPAIDPVTPPSAPLGLPYSQALTLAGGTAPFAWSLTGSPGPFSIDANTGVITGTPGALGTFAFDVVLTDACNATDTLSLSIDVIDPPTAAAPAIPELTEGVAVPAGILFTATGGDPAQYVWSHSGTLPGGLSLDNVLQGGDMVYELTGAPDVGAAGVYALDVTVTDGSTTLTDIVSVTITVNAPPAIDVTGGLVLPGATETGMWSHTFAAEAGSGTLPLTWSMGTVTGPAASLPGITLTGDTLSATSVGTPSGLYTFDVTVTDANGSSATETFSLTIAPMPTLPAELPYAQEGAPYAESVSVVVDTGTAPYTLSIVQDLAVELGMTVTIVGATLTVEGTPATGYAGQYDLQVSVTDANNVSTVATIAFVVTVKPSDSGCCGMTSQSGSAGTLWLLALLATMGVGILRRRL